MRTVFVVRVVTKDMITDFFARFKSILLGLGLIYLLQMIVKTGKETAEVFAFVYISIKKGVLFIKKLWKGGK